MLFIYRQSLSSSTDVNETLVLKQQVENIQCLVHLYIFSTYSHKNKYFLFVITNKKIYFIKTDFIEERRPGLVTSEGFAYNFVKMLAGPHRHQAKVNLYHHKKTRVSKLLISIFSTTIS
ncbi:UNVERIFIED_ORG: hypothetical protein QFZ59_002324 [Bacillus sp. B2I3]|nr:hypothetical protein [Bacillus sp. B2I3]